MKRINSEIAVLIIAAVILLRSVVLLFVPGFELADAVEALFSKSIDAVSAMSRDLAHKAADDNAVEAAPKREKSGTDSAGAVSAADIGKTGVYG